MAHRTSFLGKLLAHIPQTSKLLYPFYLAGQLELNEQTFAFDTLPPAFDGFRVAYCSDIHFGPMFSKERARALADKLNALPCDLLLLGGDFGETTATGTALFEHFALRRPPFGIFTAMGNHDLKGSEQEIGALKETFKDHGITLLQNACATVRKDGQALRLCATDDTRHGRPDVGILQPYQGFTIFMPHSPDILPQITQSSPPQFDLCLAGHTHGGQVAIWGHSIISSSRYGDRYRSGRIIENGHLIFVSNGVGTSQLPVRFGAMPQYHLITLKWRPSIKEPQSGVSV